MHELSAVADGLVLLAPNAEPPPGFEQRVLARIGATPDGVGGRSLPRRSPPPCSSIVGFGVGRSMSGARASVHEVAMRAPSGRVVGDAYLHGDDPTWVFVAVPGWTDASNEYRLRVTLADGTTTDVAGAGSWGTVLSVDAAHVREVSLVGADGTVWCSALLPQ